MRFDAICSAALLLLGPCCGHLAAEATATLPLDEILRLHRAAEQPSPPEPKGPPVSYTLDRVEYSGRLLDDGVDMKARFGVTVLAEGEWVSVPLMHKDASTHLTALPEVENGVLTVRDAELSLVTNRSGSYAFEVSFVQKAEARERQRSVTLRHGKTALAMCKVLLSEGLYRLTSDTLAQDADGILVSPSNDHFTIGWERMEELTPRTERAHQRPPIESSVPEAHAEVISTLQGERIVRVFYELRFEGNEMLSVTVPNGQRLDKVFVNGVPAAFSEHDAGATVEVIPPQAGGENGTLELILVGTRDTYLLSGHVEFVLPHLSWTVQELFVDLYLPPVFSYQWSGGSLAPAAPHEAPAFAYHLPLPGRQLSFHQYLVSSSGPSVSVDYTVDLAQKYFRP